MTAADARLWCCHIKGPDDVIPAPDKATAEAWAARINSTFGTGAAALNVLFEASAAEWPWDAESHAKGPSSEYAWLLKPADIVMKHTNIAVPS